MHCLIVRGSESTAIRRWAPDTRLNGCDFTDSVLTCGDRLGFGPLEFEVVDPGRLPPTTPEPEQPADTDVSEAPKGSQPRIPSPTNNRLVEANRLARQRARRLLAALRSTRQEAATLRSQQEDQPEQPSSDDCRPESTDTRASDLENQIEVLRAERREWERAMEEREDAHRQQKALLASQRADWEAQCKENDSERKAQAAALAKHGEDLQQQRDLMDAEQAEMEALQEAHEVERREQEDALAEREAELERQREQFDAERAQWEARRNAHHQGSPEQEANVPEQTPDRERSAQRAPETPPSPLPATAPRASQPPESPTDSGPEEESIADYMARLISRVNNIRGGASSEADDEPTRAEAKPKPDAEPLPDVEPEVAAPVPMAPRATHSEIAPSPPPVEPVREPGNVAPRAVAPERRDNLSAMRKVANFSAHSAIDRHDQRKECAASCSKMLVTFVAVMSSFGLLRLWWIGTVGSVAFFAGLVALVVATFWGVDGLRTNIRKWRGLSRSCEEEMSLATEDGQCTLPQTSVAVPSGSSTDTPAPTTGGKV